MKATCRALARGPRGWFVLIWKAHGVVIKTEADCSSKIWGLGDGRVSVSMEERCLRRVRIIGDRVFLLMPVSVEVEIALLQATR